MAVFLLLSETAAPETPSSSVNRQVCHHMQEEDGVWCGVNRIYPPRELSWCHKELDCTSGSRAPNSSSWSTNYVPHRWSFQVL
ncbi:hypothetical protein SLEP1_g52040 [Rubroshorea leprosula]|uniref:Uncharacterized protein n=1 Tax=Rubroshorea leprosula TaxID=152421 RepID=A0AAV5M555_9ROSI|nr:hypothetical protein SLEP1_g52040 [Rubroshorea leprosula]